MHLQQVAQERQGQQEQRQKKKKPKRRDEDNPYLAHRFQHKRPVPAAAAAKAAASQLSAAPAASAAEGSAAAPAASAGGEAMLRKVDDAEAAAAAADPSEDWSPEELAAAGFDPTLAGSFKSARRKAARRRAGGSLQFVEQGTWARKGEEMRGRINAFLADKEARLAARGRGLGSGSRPIQASAGGPEEEEEEEVVIAGGVELTAEERASLLPAELAVLAHLPPEPAARGEVVTMEWWDAALLSEEAQAQRSRRQRPPAGSKRGRIGEAAAGAAREVAAEWQELSGWAERCQTAALVQHPVPMRAQGSKPAPKVISMMLTKKERKRLRRQRRAAAEEEKRTKVQLGLMAPPKPKYTLANLMRQVGDDATLDPSKMEAMVREQRDERIKEHEMRNLARKLTPAERKAKRQAKMTKSDETGTHTAVFRVRRLDHPSMRFKVERNASQRFLTGVTLLVPGSNVNMVVVEGGPTAVRQYVRVMRSRIDWTRRLREGGGAGAGQTLEDGGDEDQEDEEEEDEDMEDEAGVEADEIEGDDGDDLLLSTGERAVRGRRRCSLVWQGVIQKPLFSNFRFEQAGSMALARKSLAERGAQHYWDAVVADSQRVELQWREIKGASDAAAALAEQVAAEGGNVGAAASTAAAGAAGASGLDDLLDLV